MNGRTLDEFRDGIFALRTRRFGTVAEIMIKRLYSLEESGSLAFDKMARSTNERIEVKFSTVMKENDARIRDDNVIEQCFKANLANRAMNSTEVSLYSFDCNIQQIKRKAQFKKAERRGNESRSEKSTGQPFRCFRRASHRYYAHYVQRSFFSGKGQGIQRKRKPLS